MDFDIEDRICLKGRYYLDDETDQKILELIERARTASNKSGLDVFLIGRIHWHIKDILINRSGR